MFIIYHFCKQMESWKISVGRSLQFMSFAEMERNNKIYEKNKNNHGCDIVLTSSFHGVGVTMGKQSKT